MHGFYRREYNWMTPAQWECFEMLCDLFYGAQHVSGIVRESGPSGITINARNCINKFATFDFNNLTRAVVMAHDRMIRFSIEPSGSGMLKLSFHKRSKRGGEAHERHPSLEDAAQSIREANKP